MFFSLSLASPPYQLYDKHVANANGTGSGKGTRAGTIITADIADDCLSLNSEAVAEILVAHTENFFAAAAAETAAKEAVAYVKVK